MMTFLLIVITILLVALELMNFEVAKIKLKSFSLVIYYFAVSVLSNFLEVNNSDYINVINLGFFLILSLKDVNKNMTKVISRSLSLYFLSTLIFTVSHDLFWVFLLTLFTLRVNKVSHVSFIIIGALAAFYKLYAMPMYNLSMEWIALLIVPAYYFLVTSPLKNRNHYHLYVAVYALSQFIVSRTNSLVTSLIFFLLFMALVVKIERNNDKDGLIVLLMLIVPLNENVTVLMNTYFGLIITFKMKELLVSSSSEIEFKEGEINNLSYISVLSIILSLIYLNGAIGTHSSWITKYISTFDGDTGYIIFIIVSVILMNYFVFKGFLRTGRKTKDETINDLSFSVLGVIALLINTKCANLNFLFLRPIDSIIFMSLIFIFIKKRSLMVLLIKQINSLRVPVTREIDFNDLSFVSSKRVERPKLRPTLDLTFSGISATTVWSVFVFLVSLLVYFRLK